MELDSGITYLTETKQQNVFRFSLEEIIKFWNWPISTVQNYLVLSTKRASRYPYMQSILTIYNISYKRSLDFGIPGVNSVSKHVRL